jgi:hypothetical protein
MLGFGKGSPLSRFKEGAQDSAINDKGRIRRREPKGSLANKNNSLRFFVTSEANFLGEFNLVYNTHFVYNNIVRKCLI